MILGIAIGIEVLTQLNGGHSTKAQNVRKSEIEVEVKDGGKGGESGGGDRSHG